MSRFATVAGGSTRLQACGRDQLPAAQIFSQCLAQNPIPALHCVQLLRFCSQPGKEAGDAQIGPPRRLLLAMRAAYRQFLMPKKIGELGELQEFCDAPAM